MGTTLLQKETAQPYHVPPTSLIRSTVGSKGIIALTGLGLLGFVIVHMLGNLQIYEGPDALNAYAKNLKDLPFVLWTARAGLLTIFVVHILLAIRLKRKNWQARPQGYVHEDTVQATLASRTMFITGIIILVFVVYHLAHFTFGLTDPASAGLKDPKQRHDVYAMVIRGFQNVYVSAGYIVAMFFLFFHLSHGVSSLFQTLGFNHPRWSPLIRRLAYAIAILVLVGNVSIPLAVLLRWVKMPAGGN